MKPLTKVPTSLVRDLKRCAWNDGDDTIAGLLLMFDPDTEGNRLPIDLAGQLVAVSRVIARDEKRARRDADEASRDPRCARPATVLACAEYLTLTGALQRRIWRVVAGLAVTREPGR